MTNAPEIYFFNEQVSFQLTDKRKIRAWVFQTVENEEHRLGVLNIIFTNDELLIQLNKEYLKHFTLTDIITFDLSESRGTVEGDIYISIERAKENARAYREPFQREVRRLIIHGVLHLLGYRDKTRDEQDEMRAREEYYLSLPPWA
ncbi:MAG: rRNA maturation RNase YbeY [Bacteroidales bacterium]|nr:rRNA maturation RNase YbeY [Bacteroidales bacterium]